MSTSRRRPAKKAAAAPAPEGAAGPDDVQSDAAPEQAEGEGAAVEAAPRPRPVRNEWDLALPMGKPAPEVTRHLTNVREPEKGHVGAKPAQDTEENQP